MPKSLSELQASPDVGPVERTASVCVAGKLIDQFDLANAELFDIETRIAKLEKGLQQKRESGTQRVGGNGQLTKLKKEAEAKAVEIDELRGRIQENSVELLLGADEGAMRLWLPAHPPRDATYPTEDDNQQLRYVDPAGQAEDTKWVDGTCNVADLVDDLHKWVVAYNGEPASDAWWTFVRKSGARGDLLVAASKVVGMHSQVVDPGKSRVAWLDARRSATSSK